MPAGPGQTYTVTKLVIVYGSFPDRWKGSRKADNRSVVQTKKFVEYTSNSYQTTSLEMKRALSVNSTFAQGKEVGRSILSTETSGWTLVYLNERNQSEPVQFYWFWNNGPFQICSDYGHVTATIPDTYLLLRLDDCIDG